jgi:ATP-dependent Clp protease ATP-binding subunit ClpC
MNFRFKLTKNASRAMNGAEECARQLGHDHIGAEHIFLAILGIPECGACRILKELDLAIEDLAEALKNMISGATPGMLQKGRLPLSARTEKILQMATMGIGTRDVIGTADLVQAILSEGDNAAAQLLFNVGVTNQDYRAAREAIEKGAEGEEKGREKCAAGGVNTINSKKEQKTPTINTFGQDLTEMARQGALDPVIGREKELKRVIQVLCRRTKNNAVLIGEAGVGKTAVVEGLAQAVSAGDVPERMQDKRIVALDLARMVAGTQYRGQFEERLKKVLDETKRAGNVILFLDELHTMVGAGGSEGAMDAANILKPALARGEVQVVGATTLKEYHKSIEKDAALERRFQTVMVDEPMQEDAVKILKGIAKSYEAHHVVKYTEAALEAAVKLTARYLPARLLPDKAIDAIDETGARLRMNVGSRPQEFIERRQAIDRLRIEKDAAVKAGDFDQAAEYREQIREASAAFEEAYQAWKKTHVETEIEVGEDDIAETVSMMSGVPVKRMNAMTAQALLGMEASLGEVVVGQGEAIAAIARALRRSRAFLADPKRPIGSFLFLGPTGVGKTHLAKMLAERVYGDEKALITLDMSEFQEKYSSSRLVGSPPGYVGYDEGGQLTEKVRRRPYSVVLFDEFEKADGDVMNMLLQILDDGRLTDGQGRVIDFRNTIIICTANLGFDFAKEGHSLGFASETAETSHDVLRDKLMAEAKRTFRPELLNRFDETVVFHKLDKAALKSILELELDKLRARMKPLGVTLELASAAEDFLLEKGTDAALGARPLRRIVQTYIENPLSDWILAGAKQAVAKFKVAKDGKSLEIQKKVPRHAS